MSLDAWTLLQQHSDHFARIVRCRALSGCYVATNVVARPESSLPGNCSPGVGGGGATLQQVGLVRSLSILSYSRYLCGPCVSRSYNLITQAGWNRCNLLYYYPCGNRQELLAPECFNKRRKGENSTTASTQVSGKGIINILANVG